MNYEEIISYTARRDNHRIADRHHHNSVRPNYRRIQRHRARSAFIDAILAHHAISMLPALYDSYQLCNFAF